MTDNVIFNPSAPLSPADMDLSSFEVIFEAKRTARKSAIKSIIEKNAAEGKISDYVIAAIQHDMEHAPETTNRRQLQEGNIALPPHDTLSPEETTHYLWVAINGLAIHNTFFTSTNHLSDAEFYKILDDNILDEKIRDVPPNPDMSEFIDLRSCEGSANCDRDILLPCPNRTRTPDSDPVDFDTF